MDREQVTGQALTLTDPPILLVVYFFSAVTAAASGSLIRNIWSIGREGLFPNPAR